MDKKNNTREFVGQELIIQPFYEAARKQLEQEWARDHKLKSCLIYFNMTNFRLYNAAWGIEKGNLCLRKIFQILQKHFPGKLLTHLSADHFAVLASASDAAERIDAACQEVQEMTSNPNIQLKAGIRYLSKDPSVVSLDLAFENDAALACKSISQDATRHYAVYTKEMSQISQLQNYVRENFADALAHHHIKLYFQPVVRTLTGRLTSFEVLARWESPEHGLLSPAIFIPVLEEARLIVKLDQYIMEQTVLALHRQQVKGAPLLPVSLNLSRLDFQLTDPVRLLDEALARYQLPRHLVCPEVTENALVLQDGSVRQGLERFRETGFNVWLDDFGSGYSSLNVLKDYHFHTLKLDMAFLHPFTQASRTILTSIVRMAKELGIHTLAEGVETKEQAEFLREIGCEKLQGYYYGRPLPMEEILLFCQDRNLSFESLQEATLLDKAGLVDVNQPTPVALIYDDSKNLQFLQVNTAYLRAIRSMGTENMKDRNLFLRSLDFPMQQRFRQFADRAAKSGQTETMTYVDNGQYMRANLRTVAQVGPYCIHRAELFNISLDKEANGSQSDSLDSLLRNILLAYEGIWFLDREHQVLKVIQPVNSFSPFTRTQKDIGAAFRYFAESYVHPQDRDRFLQFIDPDRILQHTADTHRTKEAEPFRVLRSAGNFDWLIITALVLPKASHRNILFCIHKPPLALQKSLHPIVLKMLKSCGITAESFVSDSLEQSRALWQSLLQYGSGKILWKDRSHRIQGASEAFARWLGLPVKSLLGKTTQDLGICVDYQEACDTDDQVLNNGQPLSGRFFHFVIRQQPRLIRADKFPLYQHGQVEGVILVFHDLEEEKHSHLQEAKAAVTDQATGLLNYRGMVMAGLRYADAYRLHGDDYTAALIDVPEFDSIGLSYGPDFRRDLLKKITAILREHLPQNMTLSRIGSCCFLLFQKAAHMDGLRAACIQVANAIHEIRQVDGFPCTLYMHYATVRGSEARSLDSLLNLLIKRMNESEEQLYGKAVYTGDHFLFDREAFDNDSQLGIVVTDLKTNQLLYSNPAMKHYLGLSSDAHVSTSGKKCYELLAGRSTPCYGCCVPQLSRSHFHSRFFHNPRAGMDFLIFDTLIPWHGRNAHFSVCIDLSRYINGDKQVRNRLSFESSMNDAIRLGMYETDPVQGIRQMMAHVGKQLEADRIILAEEKKDKVQMTYFWEAPGIPPISESFRPFLRTDLRSVFSQFAVRNSFSIPDTTEFLQDHPDCTPHIPGIRQIALARLILDGQTYGFIEAVNPSKDKFSLAEELLASLTRFFAILLRNRNMMQRLELLSRTDQLTGLQNRRGFKECLASLPENRKFAFIFGDLNDLKETNDTQGHEAGDRLLCAAADVLRQVGQEGFLFRMGGDEFLMIQEFRRMEEVPALMTELKTHFQSAGISIALGCTTASTPIENIDTVLNRADALMYRQKIRQLTRVPRRTPPKI